MVEERKRYTLEQVNQMTLLPYARTMAVVFANASWVPVLAFPHRPFRSLDHLHESMTQILKGSDENSKLQVIEQQPDLVNPPPPNDEAEEFQLFHCDRNFHERLTPEEKSRLEQVQDAYLERFGFVLVFNPTGKSTEQLLAEVEQRLVHTREQELHHAVNEAASLAYTRLKELLLS